MEIEQVIKKVKKNIFNMALGNRGSLSSVRSDNSLRSREIPIKPEPVQTQTQSPTLPSPTVSSPPESTNASNISDRKSEEEPKRDPKK